LSKIESYSITGNVLKCLVSFLSNCSQQVIVDGSFSSCSEVISGVPQGSVFIVGLEEEGMWYFYYLFVISRALQQGIVLMYGTII